uniref:Endonuclease-reverse transcriptase n=1 Tax=Parastrongyloides trichosuri TaxID=131310 RepID=A0A0N4ZL11_PARTI
KPSYAVCVENEWQDIESSHFISVLRYTSNNTKRYIYNVCIRSAFCYACQSWTWTVGSLLRLERTERSIVRRIFGLRLWKDDIRLHNEDLYKLTGIVRLSEFVLTSKIRYIGHTLRRKDATCFHRNILCWSPYQKRRTGRPRMRYMDCILKKFDVRSFGMVNNRELWRTVPQLLNT